MSLLQAGLSRRSPVAPLRARRRVPTRVRRDREPPPRLPWCAVRAGGLARGDGRRPSARRGTLAAGSATGVRDRRAFERRTDARARLGENRPGTRRLARDRSSARPGVENKWPGRSGAGGRDSSSRIGDNTVRRDACAARTRASRHQCWPLGRSRGPRRLGTPYRSDDTRFAECPDRPRRRGDRGRTGPVRRCPHPCPIGGRASRARG